jgi:hypothetical protein
VRHSFAAKVHGADQVQLNGFTVSVSVKVIEQPSGRSAGVRNEDVDAPESPNRF